MLEEETYDAGAAIITEGDVGETLYIVQEGECFATKVCQQCDRKLTGCL